ncbi:MAG TPA: PHP domain-containing protein, partial [Bacteroidales bacterium]|nr:PHP domain-containing protein [Bacteroidales bacterium]
HLVLLAKNNNGLKNIYLLQEYSYRESFNRKPLINVDILKQYSTDLICTSVFGQSLTWLKK